MKKINLRFVVMLVALLAFGIVLVACGNGSEAGGSGSTSYSVGDIILKDGTVVKATNVATWNEDTNNPAVAVIFDAGKKLGVGIKKGTDLRWAPEGTTGYSTKFETSESDGSGNWAVIKAADETGSKEAATNYPAFNFANTYGTAGDTNCSDKFATGWYLPAEKELITLDEACGGIYVSAVEASVDKIGTSVTITLDSSWYWSSSQRSNYYGNASSFKIGDGYGSGDNKNIRFDVCAIRAF